MKKIYAITLFLNIAFWGYAQLDTSFQRTTVEYGQLENQQLVDAKRHRLNQLADVKSLFKISFEGKSFPLNQDLGFRSDIMSKGITIVYEHRLKTNLSIGISLNYHRTDQTSLFQKRIAYLGIDDYVIHRFSVEIEPRWYFLKRKEIQSGKSGKNLNGLYLGNTTGLQHWQRPGFRRVVTTDGRYYNPYLKGDFQYSTLNIGWQRHFSRVGLLHFQLGAGIRHNEKINFPEALLPPDSYFEQPSKWQALMTYKVGIGIALGKAENTRVNKPILEFHQEDLTMFKLDLFPIFLGTGKNQLLSKINIEYEQGIKGIPFSINTTVTYLHYGKYDYEIYGKHFSLQISPRFYYNLKKQKRIHNLSANYFSIRSQWNIINNRSYNKYSFAPIWGMQRRVFKRMFVNYEFGYEFSDNSFFERYIISELKIGLAF
ncbi:MAG: hypothetical protein AB8G86_02495 [Saprospiraceae bacterium]